MINENTKLENNLKFQILNVILLVILKNNFIISAKMIYTNKKKN